MQDTSDTTCENIHMMMDELQSEVRTRRDEETKSDACVCTNAVVDVRSKKMNEFEERVKRKTNQCLACCFIL